MFAHFLAKLIQLTPTCSIFSHLLLAICPWVLVFAIANLVMIASASGSLRWHTLAYCSSWVINTVICCSLSTRWAARRWDEYWIVWPLRQALNVSHSTPMSAEPSFRQKIFFFKRSIYIPLYSNEHSNVHGVLGLSCKNNSRSKTKGLWSVTTLGYICTAAPWSREREIKKII